MGAYPYLSCRDWSMISQDIQELDPNLVSVALATDPFGDYDEALLNECFNGSVRRWKEHYVIDLRLPIDEIGSKSRRKNARRSLRKVDVEVVSDPAHWLDEWIFLWSQLVQRHRIFGLRAFSRSAFMKQLAVPGVVVLQAKHHEDIVGAQMYFIDGDIVHSHLSTTTSEGYRLGVTGAMDQFSIAYFADRAHWLNLGGGLGSSKGKLDGLSYYKKSWATNTRWSYFCGHVINRERYDSIVNASGLSPTSYFPLYREGEYG